jgi:hypothetical protein
VRLAERLRAEGGLLAGATADGDVPFTAEEAIREGELAHYGDPRVLRTGDRDLALLAGDQLYALGLAQLAAAGDLPGIRRLAAVIARCAQAHAEGRPEDARAAWEGM